VFNGVVRVKIDTVTGAIRSVRWHGRELVDTTAGGWNEYRYVAGYDPGQVIGVSGGVRISVVDSGPLVASLRIESPAPGGNGLVRIVRLVAGSSDIEIETILDKRAVREKEGVHLVFPFRVSSPVVRYDQAGIAVRAERDQLPGANRNVYAVGRWVDVSGPALGVTLVTLDAPLVEIGGLTAEAWHHRDGTESWLPIAPRSATVVSYVMNNYWHTNFKADQEGMVRFRYVVRPHGAFDAAAAQRFGIERSR
jgi:alpha-mannosidase